MKEIDLDNIRSFDRTQPPDGPVILARMEAPIAIGRFARRFPDCELTGNSVLGGRIRFRGLARLPAQPN